MENLLASDLLEIERKLLAVFERHGADGRAITIESLAVNTSMQSRSREFASALKDLAARGLIKRAGEDLVPGSPVAFRLVQRLSPDAPGDAAKDAPRHSSPPLSPVERMDGRTRAAKSALRRRASVPAA
ncbi:hypothetical protein [Bradyrhizobium liaoningense]|uniref:hypothetical protein n=1 Tax=Bradyrhizobium liaoningense TaxID=43992 RepID=UPI001BAA03A8|nr:hypothetical protein [Bradyrhizobium liaoningense]MBR0707963.1 hypothetical protein [Bradyrhizobium liaoningense]